MDYTITINPENWDVFLQTKPLKFAFRETMLSELKKVNVNDRFVVYLAQEMCWSGIFKVTKQAYKSSYSVYPSEPSFGIVVEVVEIFLPKITAYIPIKEPLLWSSLQRFHGVSHKKSGWIYNAKLARSLCRISSSDTEKILSFFKHKNA